MVILDKGLDVARFLLVELLHEELRVCHDCFRTELLLIEVLIAREYHESHAAHVIHLLLEILDAVLVN